MSSARSNRAITDTVLAATRATTADRGPDLQSLWSGYGEICRYHLAGAEVASVIVKHVRPPNERDHPRGWNTDRSHARKLRSYAVELAFYRDYARRCDDACRTARVFAADEFDGGWLFVLEDLDASGFAGRRSDVSDTELARCLRWLAAFHATFLGVAPDDLWEVGTYWHLATRPDELAAIENDELRDAAPRLDARLNECTFATLVHGDAKLANFCFGPDGVAAVDFQYVGGGSGIKDVAYLLSCLDADRCERYAPQYLDTYFAALRSALARRRPEADAAAIEAEGRALYPIAWADFYRFLAGWAPQHAKIDRYSQRLTRDVLRTLRGDARP